ncbi:MAG: hypothetical protein GY716_16090 [bacterium]|nr:hypothetical protein [bacterium]
MKQIDFELLLTQLAAIDAQLAASIIGALRKQGAARSKLFVAQKPAPEDPEPRPIPEPEPAPEPLPEPDPEPELPPHQPAPPSDRHGDVMAGGFFLDGARGKPEPVELGDACRPKYLDVPGREHRLVGATLSGDQEQLDDREVSGPGLELEDGMSVANAEYANIRWVGLTNPNEKDPDEGYLQNVSFENFWLHNAFRWGARARRMGRGLEFRYCTIARILQEHGLYFNLDNSEEPWEDGEYALLISHCLFEDLGSQAIQCVSAFGREHETPVGKVDQRDGPPIRIEDTLIYNSGANRDWGRASFALSFFDDLNDLELKRVEIDNRHQNYDAQIAADRGEYKTGSRGCLLVSGVDPALGRKVTLADCMFRRGWSRQELAGFRNCAAVRITGSTFEGEGPGNRLQFSNCAQILIGGCRGNARIVVDGKDVSSVADGYRQG